MTDRTNFPPLPKPDSKGIPFTRSNPKNSKHARWVLFNVRVEHADAAEAALLGTAALAIAERDALAQRVKELVNHLTDVLRHFPTDEDMHAAGWSSQEIEDACAAYDCGRAAMQQAGKAEGGV